MISWTRDNDDLLVLLNRENYGGQSHRVSMEAAIVEILSFSPLLFSRLILQMQICFLSDGIL